MSARPSKKVQGNWRGGERWKQAGQRLGSEQKMVVGLESSVSHLVDEGAQRGEDLLEGRL